MRLGYFDRANPKIVYILPKRTQAGPLFPLKSGEYAERFLAEILGLGNICIVTVRGSNINRRAHRTI